MATITDPTEKKQALEGGTYDVPDLATLMKCSNRHVRRMIDAREIPGLIRFGRLVRFHKGIVDCWPAKRRREPVPVCSIPNTQRFSHPTEREDRRVAPRRPTLDTKETSQMTF